MTTTSSTSGNKTAAELLFEENLAASPTMDISEKILIDKIIRICNQERHPFDTNPFIYYEEFREKDPIICELAMTVFAAPATQVSVERSFSALKLLITHTRTSLKPCNINNILTISLNRDLLNRVNFENMLI